METGNWKLVGCMKEVFKLDVYRLAEELSGLIWFAYDRTVRFNMHSGNRPYERLIALPPISLKDMGDLHLRIEGSFFYMLVVHLKRLSVGCVKRFDETLYLQLKSQFIRS